MKQIKQNFLEDESPTLKVNKVSLNSGKTELILFRSKTLGLVDRKNIICKTKYLGLILDENLAFKYYLENFKLKLNRANCLLSKMRYFAKFSLLRTTYYALSVSNMGTKPK